MNYSFIQPGKKTLLKKVSRIWLGYIFLTLLIFLTFVMVLKVQEHWMRSKTQIATTTQTVLLEEVQQLQEQLVLEQEKIQFIQYITTQNTLLKESIENLFGLIPEQITLNKVQMEQQQLTLYGTTPSKQIYTFLLEVPLRSIFHQSRADFYMLPNGWYNFVSVSKLKEDKQ